MVQKSSSSDPTTDGWDSFKKEEKTGTGLILLDKLLVMRQWER